MLPTGHLAAGYLTTKLAVLALAGNFPQANDPRFWATGLIASIAVDIDEFYSFSKIGRFIGSTKEVNHRRFVTHAPLLHLALGVVAFLTGWLAANTDLQLYAIFYVIGMWTHFFFDSFGYGIMWLRPITSKMYSFHNPEIDFYIPSRSPVEYWKKFLVKYRKDFVFYLEISVLLLALLVKFRPF